MPPEKLNPNNIQKTFRAALYIFAAVMWSSAGYVFFNLNNLAKSSWAPELDADVNMFFILLQVFLPCLFLAFSNNFSKTAKIVFTLMVLGIILLFVVGFVLAFLS